MHADRRDAGRTAAARRDSARRPRTRPACPWDAAARGGRCRRRRAARPVMPLTLTCSRSTRRIDVARRAAAPASSPSTCQGSIACRSSSVDAVVGHLAEQREAELEVRREPLRLEAASPASLQLAEHFREILRDEVRQHEAVVQRVPQRTSGCAIGRFPEPGHQRAHAATAASGSSARAAASRSCATRPAPAGRSPSRANTACRCRTRRGACCRSRRSAGCGRGGRPATADRRWPCRAIWLKAISSS